MLSTNNIIVIVIGIVGIIINNFIHKHNKYGPQGKVGKTGPIGPKGPKGSTGQAGSAGQIGVTGPQGSVGPRGEKGEQGIQGRLGDIGPMGPQGQHGPHGPQGPQGAKGLKGDKGDQGLRGIQGLKGDIGPQGAKGLKGDKGDQGLRGIQGLKGDIGPQGLKGDKGYKGDIGLKGDKGDQGPSGRLPHPFGSCPPGMKHDNNGSAICRRTGKGLNTRRNCTLDKNDKGLPLCSSTIGSNSRPTGIGAKDANTPTIATGQLSLKNRLVWANRNDYDAQANQMNWAISQDVRYDANTPVMTYEMWAPNESAPKICPNKQKTCDKSKKVHPYGGFNPLVMNKKTVSVNGGLNITGGKSKHNPYNWRTYFNWHTDNKNYIRGDTEMRGNMGTIGDVTVGGKLCMPGEGCISRADFKNLKNLAQTDVKKIVKHGDPITIRSHRGYRLQDSSGNAIFDNENRGGWETMQIEKCGIPGIGRVGDPGKCEPKAVASSVSAKSTISARVVTPAEKEAMNRLKKSQHEYMLAGRRVQHWKTQYNYWRGKNTQKVINSKINLKKANNEQYVLKGTINRLTNFLKRSSSECPYEFPYPVKKGEFISGGLCYNNQQYANQGSGSIGSWCARTPENNKKTKYEIKKGMGKRCVYCPQNMKPYGDGSACKDSGGKTCALHGNPGAPRCY